MGRKPTGRTTKVVRVPLEYADKVEDYLELLKMGDYTKFAPFPESVTKDFLNRGWDSSQWAKLGRQLQAWTKKAVTAYGPKEFKKNACRTLWRVCGRKIKILAL